MTKEELIGKLIQYDVPVEKWGTGEAKSIEHLLTELNDGEATLLESGRVLLRYAEGAVVNVYHQVGNKLFKLVEKKQVFANGRERKRELETSIGEKLKPGENSLKGAYRALTEELGITELLPLISQPPVEKGPVPSQSYPGLLTKYVMFVYDVYLPERWYKPEGYAEVQKDKTTFFKWQ